MKDEMKHIAVIGSGTMGNGIAHVFAQNGFSVALIDTSAAALEKGLATIARNLDRIVAKGNLSAEQKAQTLQRIRTFTHLPGGLTDAGLIVEAATENVDLKLQIFMELDELARPEAILATNTSSISSGAMPRPTR